MGIGCCCQNKNEETKSDGIKIGIIKDDYNIKKNANNKIQDNNIKKREKENSFYNGNNIEYETEENNYISAEINIEEDDINEDIRIINTFEESKKINEWPIKEDDYKYNNEKEIKENCKILINNKVIPFNYSYVFKEKGKYLLTYKFKKNIKNVAYMFYECRFLTNIDLSNFNTENVTNMSHMFSGCKYLTNIDLSILILKMLLI